MSKQILINLGLTILLELPIQWLFLRKEKFWHLVLFCILLNSFTLPLATMAYFDLGLNYFLVEMSVVIVEAMILWKFWRISVSKAILIAAIANLATALLGLLLAEEAFRIVLP